MTPAGTSGANYTSSYLITLEWGHELPLTVSLLSGSRKFVSKESCVLIPCCLCGSSEEGGGEGGGRWHGNYYAGKKLPSESVEKPCKKLQEMGDNCG